MGAAASFPGRFELLWDDAEQLSQDVWQLLKLPLEVVYNDFKMLQWAWGHPISGLTATVAGALWGSVVLQNMPGDFAYVGPLIGAMSGCWTAYYAGEYFSGNTPPNWQIVSVTPGSTESEAIKDFSEVVGFVAFVGVKPWLSNTSFLAGATLGWLVLPNFPMSMAALLSGVGAMLLTYQYSGGKPANPAVPPTIG